MFYVQNILIYLSFGGVWVGRTWSTAHILFITQKKQKNTRVWHILISNSTFWFKTIFPRMNNKNFTERGSLGTPLLFLYKVSIIVLINFTAILLTLGIFLIQIVNTNNTNVYLIHFYSKNNIKIHIPKSYV